MLQSELRGLKKWAENLEETGEIPIMFPQSCIHVTKYQN